MSDPIYDPRSEKKFRENDSVANLSLQFSELPENGTGALFVHLHFSDLVIWPNLDIRRSEYLPKLATSFSPTDLVKQKLRIW